MLKIELPMKRTTSNLGKVFFATLYLSVDIFVSPPAIFSQTPPARRPNFLVIIADDQRAETVQEAMPKTRSRIFDAGITFANGYVTTPVCTPSRSSILTGMYAAHHGVRDNETQLRFPTFVDRLHDAGYYTGLVGKYMNSWDGSPRPEFDYWIGIPADDKYYDPQINVAGNWVTHRGYLTYLLRDYVSNFLKKAVKQSEPFCLIFAPKTPHTPLQAAPGDENLYPGLAPFRPPSFNEPEVSDKPRWLQNMPLLTTEEQQAVDSLRQKQLQMLWSLDQTIDSILDELQTAGELDSTVILYISDNGYLWGEHRLTGKVRVYEPSIRVPFAMRYPPLAQTGAVEKKIVANIDIAPTIYQLAGLPIPKEVDGCPLPPLISPQHKARTEILIEGDSQSRPRFAAVHSGRYVYIDNDGDDPEFYDLIKDPEQLDNGVDNPGYAGVVKDLKNKLSNLLVGVCEPSVPPPVAFALQQNYPNPFKNATTIRYNVRERAPVTIQIFDLQGRLVTKLVDREVEPGNYAVRFNPQALANGIYFYRMQVGGPSGAVNFVQQRKLVVIQ